MCLELEIIKVKDICFGATTNINDGLLTINKQELIETISDRALKQIDIELAKPGDSIRIIPVKDAIEPRIKVDTGEFFPGVLGGFTTCGEGKTRVLRGCGVITTGQIVAFQEGLIDMSGPGAEHSHYAKLNNVVLVAEPAEGINPSLHEKAVRIAGLKIAQYLAKAALEVQPDEVEVYELKPVPVEKKLPRIVYVHQVLAQGLLHNNYIYGLDAKQLHPTILHPNEFMDGALVSGNCVTACDKNTTFDHENNPVIAELYSRHGVDLDFAGVIATPASTVLADKERCCMATVNLARQMKADAMIIAEEGGGNPEADLMMICARAEKCGIKTVIMLHENAGDDGTSESITDSTPEADAVISVGNNQEKIDLPKMEKTIGHLSAVESLAGSWSGALKGDGSIQVKLAVIMDSISNLGITKLSATTY